MTMTTKKLDMTNHVHALGALMPMGGNDYDPKLIASRIRMIGATGAKLDSYIHTVAFALIHRSVDHRDCSMVSTLLAAMPKGGRVKALVAWFTAFSNIHIRQEKSGAYKCNMHGPDTKLYKALDLDKAFTTPYYTVAETDVNPAAFDDKRFEQAVNTLIKRALADTATISAATKDKVDALRKLVPAA